jgi:hypothetical protein
MMETQALMVLCKEHMKGLRASSDSFREQRISQTDVLFRGTIISGIISSINSISITLEQSFVELQLVGYVW